MEIDYTLLKEVFDRIPVIGFISQSGAGKETQIKLLEKVYNLMYPEGKFFLSETGQLFRDEIPKMVPWAQEILLPIQQAGKRQSSDIAKMLWMHKVLYEAKSGPIFIDGSPRSLEEAKTVCNFFVNDCKRDVIFFYVNVTDPECTRRILARNVLYAEQGREIRDDCSTIEKIQVKLSWFHVDVIPAIKFLSEAPGVSLYEVKSDEKTSKEEVHAQIINILQKHQTAPKEVLTL